MPRRAVVRLAPRASRAFPSVLRLALIAIAALGCGAGEGGERGGPSTAKPNLLLVTIDTLRPDALACYGGAADVGRYLCSLASAGTRFEWAFSAAPYTAPSIASVLTGLYPHAHGVRQSAVSFLHGDVETLPALLKRAGYTTAAFISNPVLERSRQLDRGFDVFDQRMPRQERNRPGFVEREARSATDAALAWAQVAATPPWFLWVHYQDPHGPYEPPDASVGYDPPGEARLRVLEQDDSGDRGIPHYQALPGLFTLAGYRGRYLDEIRYLEKHLQRLVEGLDALGSAPAILVTSDHGEAFGEDEYYFAHGHSVGIDQIHVPLFWRPPTPAAPTVVSTPVSLVDVGPTFLRAAGVAVPESWSGRPLPVSGNEAGAAAADRAIFSEHAMRAAVVKHGRYYARDRDAIVANLPDANSGGRVRVLPSRSAELEPGTAVARYRNVEAEGVDPELESELERFLERARLGRAGATHEQATEELKERLRALGYSE